MWFIHLKIFSVAWKIVEVKAATEPYNGWIALFLLLGAFSTQGQCLWASDTCLLSLKDNPREACFSEAYWNVQKRSEVCAWVNVHTKTSQRVPAFPSAIILVHETLILSATEQRDRKRRGLAVLAGKVFCDLCTLIEAAGLATFLTHCL